MGTIFGIVTAAGILALCGVLDEGLIAFLSGLAGYVLGGIQQGHTTQNVEPAKGDPS